MEKIKEKDFIEIEYTGKIKEDDTVFDTTDQKTAESSGLDTETMQYGPVTICLGQNHLIHGLEAELIGKEIGKEYDIDIPAEDAFGKKSAKLIQLIPTKKFLSQNIQPIPGLQINIDGAMGTIKTVSGGRTIVDFNHPLSGKDLNYKVKANKIVADDKEKLKTLLKFSYGVETEIDIKDGIAEIQSKNELPKEHLDAFKEQINEIIPAIKDIKFIIKK